MGWIEDLERKKVAEDEADRIRRQNAKDSEISAQETAAEKSRKWWEEERKREQKWKQAKDLFEQTGIRQIAQRLIKARAASSLQEETWAGHAEHGNDRHNSFDEKLGDFNAFLEISTHGYAPNFGCNYIALGVSLDGSVTLEGSRVEHESVGSLFWKKEIRKYIPVRISVSKNEWTTNRRALEEALGKVYPHPKHYSYYDSTGIVQEQTDFGFCLSLRTNIDTPSGFIKVEDLKIEDLVWTIDRYGNKIKTKIIKLNRKTTSSNNKMARIVLEDGRKLIVSPGHPTVDYRSIGSLRKGDLINGSRITSIKILPYTEKYTYDILPDGETGAYWANNVLIGSTLFNKFKTK